MSSGVHQSSSIRTRFWTPPLFVVAVEGVLPVRIAALMVMPFGVPVLAGLIVPGQGSVVGALATAWRLAMGWPDSAKRPRLGDRGDGIAHDRRRVVDQGARKR